MTKLDRARSEVTPFAPGIDARREGHGVIGVVDAVDERGVRGWTLQTQDPARPVTLSFNLGGYPLGAAETNIRRSDLDPFFGPDSRNGFHLQVSPESILKAWAALSQQVHPSEDVRLEVLVHDEDDNSDVRCRLKAREGATRPLEAWVGLWGSQLPPAFRALPYFRFVRGEGCEPEGVRHQPIFEPGRLRAAEVERLFFDRDHYLRRYPDVAEAGLDPFEHYLARGAQEFRDPHPLFSAKFYAAQLRAAKIAFTPQGLFADFIQSGDGADFDPHPCFDCAWYRRTYRLKAGVNPWLDYLVVGWLMGTEPNWLFDTACFKAKAGKSYRFDRSPIVAYLDLAEREAISPHPLFDLAWVGREKSDSHHLYAEFMRRCRSSSRSSTPLFDAEHYLAQIPPGTEPPASPFKDYLEAGEARGLQPNPLFWPLWYAERAGLETPCGALAHYVSEGSMRLLDPSPIFSTSYYLANNSDVALARVLPLRHYLVAGERELRRPHPCFDPSWYARRTPEANRVRPLSHFLSTGAAAGLSPHPAVRAAARAPAGANAWLAPFVRGGKEGLRAAAWTDVLFDRDSEEGDVVPTQAGKLGLLDDFEDAVRRASPLPAGEYRESINRMSSFFDYREAERYLAELADWMAPDAPRPPVSVIIPTRNRAGTILRAIESARNQTYGPCQIVVIDDGSTDNTHAAIRAAGYESDVTYVACRHGGVSSARNAGLEAATGEIIAYLDSDNYWEPNYLDVMVASLRRSGAETAYAALRLFNEKGDVKYRGDRYDAVALSRENYIDMNIFVHTRRLVEEGYRFDEGLRRCVDWDFIKRACLSHEPIYVPVVGCNYVDENDRLGRITTEELAGDYFRLALRDFDFNLVTTGCSRPDPSYSLVWPVFATDGAQVIDRIWEAAWHVRDGAHELIILANGLSASLKTQLKEIARRTTGVRVVDLWRNFHVFGAAQVGAALAIAETLVFWRSDLSYERRAVDRLAGSLDKARECRTGWLLMPLVADASGDVRPNLLRPDRGSSIVDRIGGRAASFPRGAARRLAALEFPVAADRQRFNQLGGFDTDFSDVFGLADLCLKAMAAAEESTVADFDLTLTIDSGAPPADSKPDEAKEWSAFRARWIGREVPDPILPDGYELPPTRDRKFEVINWTLRSRPARSSIRRARSPGLTTLDLVIRSPAPAGPAGLAWGDLHYAHAMAAAFGRLGHRATVAPRDAWPSEMRPADCVIHLRGAVAIQPAPEATNVLWVISHPDRLTAAELEQCDHVFVPSVECQRDLAVRFGVRAKILPQATDADRFGWRSKPPCPELARQFLFVGNSRRVARPLVLEAVRQQLDLSVYGGDWDFFIDPAFIKGSYVPNEDLSGWYGSARCVLNDHWPSMQQFGIVSNRLFDVVAAGGVAISDAVDGIEDLFGEHVQVCRSLSDLGELARRVDEWKPSTTARRAASRRVRAEHSFDARMGQLLQAI